MFLKHKGKGLPDLLKDVLSVQAWQGNPGISFSEFCNFCAATLLKILLFLSSLSDMIKLGRMVAVGPPSSSLP